MELNEDGTVSIQAARLTAAGVDETLRELAKLRAQMQPPVPHRLDLQSGDNLLVLTDPALVVGQSAHGVALSVRHTGFGWCTFVLPPGKAAQLQRFIAKRTAHEDVRFVDEEAPRGPLEKH